MDNFERKINKLIKKKKEKYKNSSKEEKLEKETDNENILYLKYRGEKYAKGTWDNNEFIILKGSKIANNISENISKSLIKAVEIARSNENVVEKTFIKDYKCKSPSMAATIILGINTNGRTAWKNRNGKSIKELEEIETLEKYLN